MTRPRSNSLSPARVAQVSAGESSLGGVSTPNVFPDTATPEGD